MSDVYHSINYIIGSGYAFMFGVPKIEKNSPIEVFELMKENIARLGNCPENDKG